MHLLVVLAKKAVESYIGTEKIIQVPEGLPKEFLEKRAGTFVTIEKNGNLRGCIGTYLPTKKNIAEEIIQNAIAAATEDYRFGPIQKTELSNLSYTVCILEKPELIKSIKELDPQKYGIIVKTTPIARSNGTDVVFNEFSIHFTSPRFNGHFAAKSALLLPDLEGVDTIEQQISITCRKGGIDPSKEKIIIYKFKVEKFEQ
jgi:AmmeMemoRadiSam system protein A